MKGLFEELRNVLEKGEEAVLVTIIASTGSTPRGAGSRMLVRQDGTIKGTVGGGAVEYQSILTAMEAMKQKASHTKGFQLNKNQAASIGMVCGGNVVVYFQYISAGDKEFADFCTRVLETLKEGEASWLILDITEETCWKMGLYSSTAGVIGIELPEHFLEMDLFGANTRRKEAEGRSYYTEPLVQAGTVYVFGGGHVAQELVPMLTHVDFRCVVMDDREEFANPTMFPDAVKTVVGDLRRFGDYIHVKPCDYICALTRGHMFDYYVQKQALALHPCYIGVMGSRNKIRLVTQKLLEDGFSKEEIEGCHMPIGVEIHAETPAEIAVSIAGELISVRARGMGHR